LRIKLIFITVTLYSKNYTINARVREVVNQYLEGYCVGLQRCGNS
jgi:hypothetical protein